MSLITSLLISIAGLIYFGLGTLHLVYTFFSNKFEPWESDLTGRLQHSTLRITRQTTFWKAWIGFNASHSTGAAFFCVVLILTAWTTIGAGAAGQVVWALSIVHSGFYVWLARRYWFRVPLAGTAIATLLLLVAGFIQLAQS